MVEIQQTFIVAFLYFRLDFPPAAPPRKNIKNPVEHILVINDDEVFIFRETLKDMNLICKLTWEKDTRVIDIYPDIIFLDVDMP